MSKDSGISSIIEKAKMVMTKPSEFFESVKSEPGIGPAFKYFAIILLVPIILFSLLIFVGISGLLGPSIGDLTGGLPIMVAPILIYVILLVAFFVFAGFPHLSAKLLKGSGNYAATYKALAYAETPSFLLGWIPIVGPIFGLWSLYLMIKGLSTLHDVSMGRAVLIIFFPLVVLVILAVILGVVFALTAFTG